MQFVHRTFSVADYVIFGIMLVASTAIGSYYAIKDRKKKNTDDYLLAGRSMSPYPVAFSLSVSFMSAVLILGTPAEVYRFGTMYGWYIAAFLTVTIITAEVFIPTFYNMGLSSVYEYLEYRFNRPVRLAATVIYMIQTILYIGIVVYAPALALNAVTGLNLWGAVVSTGIVCIIYSSLGGLKAVVWTDAVQCVFMLIGFIAILIQGCILMGGIENVWRKSVEGGRIDFLRFDTDPRVRHSFWSINVGAIFISLYLWGVNQAQVQRYLSCRSLKDAKIAIYVNWVGLLLLNSLAILCGLVMYAYYKDCDPVKLKVVARHDQLIAYMVLDIFQNNPGMPGIFLSSVYAGSLSSVSTGITALSSVTVQDFMKPCLPNWSDEKFFWASRALVVIYGLLAIFFAYLTSQLGAILQAAISIMGLVGGPLVGVFTLGMIFPCANSIGALCGLLTGVASTTWVFIGSKVYKPLPEFSRELSYSTTMCTNLTTPATTSAMMITSSPVNMTLAVMTSSPVNMTSPAMTQRPPIADLYSMSYVYYSAFGFLFTMVFGLGVSFATGGYKQRKKVDPNLHYPIFDHWLFSWLPSSVRRKCWCGVKRDAIGSRSDEGHQDVPITMTTEALMSNNHEESPIPAGEKSKVITNTDP